MNAGKFETLTVLLWLVILMLGAPLAKADEVQDKIEELSGYAYWQYAFKQWITEKPQCHGMNITWFDSFREFKRDFSPILHKCSNKQYGITALQKISALKITANNVRHFQLLFDKSPGTTDANIACAYLLGTTDGSIQTAKQMMTDLIEVACRQSAVNGSIPTVVSYQFNEKAAPVGLRALVGIEDIVTDCVQNLVFGTVEKVVFRDATLRIEGFRLKTQSGDYLYINVDSRVYDRLPSVDAGWITPAIKEGRRVAVAYQQCGAGGRVFSARDIYFR